MRKGNGVRSLPTQYLFPAAREYLLAQEGVLSFVCLPCCLSNNVASRIKWGSIPFPPSPLFMNSVSEDAGAKFEQWLGANELQPPRDFKFAFTCAQRAFEACPEAPVAAADAWNSITHDDVEVASSWTLWTKSRRSSQGQEHIH